VATFLPALLAALSAGVWGTGDFCGGKASQRENPLAVTVLSQILAVPVLVVVVVAFFHGWPPLGLMLQDVVAGFAGFAGIVFLYRGLASGAMAVFAPITAVTSALIPMVVGLIQEQTPSPLPLAGAICAIVAIALVSMSGGRDNDKVTPALVGLALASGGMFGAFFAILGQPHPDQGMWPLAGVRIGSIGLGLATAAVTRTSLRMARVPLLLTLVAGTFDISANALFVAASSHGQLSIVAPIASLYPVSTVLLALAVDHERVRPIQLAGLGLAATALVLVAT
jgi:drug/metabolite transporter (DMT)-like permease